jgi:hypothetical protein
MYSGRYAASARLLDHYVQLSSAGRFGIDRVMASRSKDDARRSPGDATSAALWSYGRSSDDPMLFSDDRWAIRTKIVRDRTAYLTRCPIERFTKVRGWP